ncbi:Fc.00g112770.m01.CDS01 [Cosmosporella sp. VM-42]
MAGSTRDRRLLKELGKVGFLFEVASDGKAELIDLAPQIHKDGLPPGIDLIQREDSVAGDWLLDIRVLDQNPLYKGDIYRLKFKFPKMYPIEPPEVTFEKTTDRPIPIHPHIYSNGIICLDLLGQQGWSPVQSVQSVCMSIQSMLTSNNKNERPPGDEEFVRQNRQRPRDIDFLYHDNTV